VQQGDHDPGLPALDGDGADGGGLGHGRGGGGGSGRRVFRFGVHRRALSNNQNHGRPTHISLEDDGNANFDGTRIGAARCIAYFR
jgi:hypothetical protein